VPVPEPVDHTWVALTDDALPIDAVGRWAAQPSCGAVVTFTGTVRDHAHGRPGVTDLTYEAYEAPATQRMGEVVAEVRRRWPAVVRVAVLHRVGHLQVGEPAVVVAASSAHRADAFAAAAFCIDATKATVPIWKREAWADGEAWGTDATDVVAVGELR
jgi:molybdopterin synthase catalytic subunit